MALSFPTALRNARADAITTFAATTPTAAPVKIRFYTTPRPASANATATGTLLAELTASTNIFAGSASQGAISVNSFTSQNAVSTNTAAWFRIVKSDGTTVIMDGTLNADMAVSTTAFTAGSAIAFISMTITEGNP